MQYRLRTLLIVLAVLPPVLAGVWIGGGAALAEAQRRRQEYIDSVDCGPNTLKPATTPSPPATIKGMDSDT
ncbi:MAG: hypothetical protein WD872_15360 [Pirellulaceae bacterium]